MPLSLPRMRVTDAEGATTRFEVDALGRVIEIIDPVIESPVDRTDRFVYDQAGNLIQRTDRLSRVTQFSYDSLNRLSRIDE